MLNQYFQDKYYIDRIVINAICDACYDLGSLFGFGAREGFYLWIVFIGGALVYILGGGLRGDIDVH